MTRFLIALCALLFALPAAAQGERRLPGPLPTHEGLVYVQPGKAEDPRKLDLYLPPADGKVHPLVIFTHGSAWMANNGREDAHVLAAELNPRGYAVAGVAVRTSAQARFPGQVFDIKAAIRWLRAHAGQYALDPGHIGIVGESSGGWTAAMAALTGGFGPLEGRLGNARESSRVQAAIAYYPPTDFAVMDDWALEPCRLRSNTFERAFCHAGALSPESRLVGCKLAACPDKVQLANPIRYITPDDAPMLIVHGAADALVPHAQGEMLYHALARACRTASFVSLPVAGHGNWSGMLTDPKLGYGATIQSTTPADCGATAPVPVAMGWPVLVEFLDAHLKR